MFIIESVAKSFGYTIMDFGVLMDGIRNARLAGGKVYLHINWGVINNYAPPEAARPDWRLDGGTETAVEVQPVWNGLAIAIAEAMANPPKQDGSIYYPIGMQINDNPDFADW